MVLIVNRVHRILMIVIAVVGVVIIASICTLAIYTKSENVPTANRLLTYLYHNKVIYLENGGKVDSNNNLHDDMIIPGKYAWIPYPQRRNPSGPFIIKNINGKSIKYTNYTFYPLTFNSSFLINNQNICKDTDNLTFLIMVHTAVQHFDRRKALRETWANPRLLKYHESRLLFLVGRTETNTFQKALEIESLEFKDIVQGDFIDDYHNLTHKGILGYRWIVKYCENAQFVLKIDDDVFVNIFLVIHNIVPKYREDQRIIACRVLTNETIAREGKFAVDADYFPGYKSNPLQYCPGPFVLMLRHIIPEMYEVAKTIPFYWVDDLYLFGILPNQIGNVSFQFVENIDNNEESALKCFREETKCKYLAAYAWTKGVMYKYWDATLFMYKDLVQKYANVVR